MLGVVTASKDIANSGDTLGYMAPGLEFCVGVSLKIEGKKRSIPHRQVYNVEKVQELDDIKFSH